jgi:hypothetical protein
METVSRRSILGGALTASLVAAPLAAQAAARVQETPRRVASVPGLTDEQAGHLRHFRNLAQQDDGDWTDMQRGAGGLGADYKYQMALMTYAMSLAHYHHLPAAPGFFKADFDRIVHKMMLRDVWENWIDISPSSPLFDPNFKQAKPHNWNPVSDENIMYSGHLNAMAALYSYYFEDNKYDEVGSIRFTSGLARFLEHRGDATLGQVGDLKVDEAWLKANVADYNLQSLNDVIYWQNVANGYMGVACEPNQIFVVCNQFPMLGFRFQDLRKGTGVADELARGYKAAWARKGFMMPNGKDIHRQWKKSGDRVYGPSSPWTYAFLNPVNRDIVQETYPFVRKTMGKMNPDGTYVAYPTAQWEAVRKTVDAGGAFPQPIRDPDAFATGSTSLLFSEMGDPNLQAHFAYVDKYMSPTWKNGGLYYPRSSKLFDERG